MQPGVERTERAGAINRAHTDGSVGIASSPSGLGEEVGRRGPLCRAETEDVPTTRGALLDLPAPHQALSVSLCLRVRPRFR
ncbi:MAG: hypothetical protein AVDCRST_MAG68-2769 [uncultured Gemmatimonadetes bacterium]|uniref:Uncharacterized protein n=1 Tax=uncultured Gemmatimonadota bacterium TaxID=203437 RepID=A0A6J4KZA3_9BACT|nr:MAG: hypothetical protein AVDCRST_MAG68-2769 [uncultured Gemmatimonadota bacterium]